MRTSPIISFSNYGLETKLDATITANNIESFVDVDDLKWGNHAGPYASYEQDFWVLDGTYKFMPTTGAHAGIVGAELSDDIGDFGTSTTVTFTFSEVHTTSGLNLTFSESGDYHSVIQVVFYNAADAVIRDDVYNPTDPTFSTNQAVVNFKKITVELGTTSKDYRRGRLLAITFDTLSEFTDAEIRECAVVNEVQPLSLEFPIDTLHFGIHSTDPSFQFINPVGIGLDFTHGKALDVHEEVGQDTKYIGRFYLDNLKALTETDTSFDCVDALGLLDGMTYRGHVGDILLTDLLDDIFLDTGISYELDPALVAYELAGFIPVCTRREALQKALFGALAWGSTAGTGLVRINQTVLASDVVSPDHNVLSDDITIESLDSRPQVTGVEFVRGIYFNDTDTPVEIYSADFPAGDFTVAFTEPHYHVTVTGATKTFPESTDPAFLVKFSVATPGTVTIDASPMYLVNNPASVYNLTLDASAKQNIVKVEGSLLAFSEGWLDSTYAQFIYDYYLQRRLQRSKIYQIPVNIGRSVLIDSLAGNTLLGVVEKMSTDLAGGFISDVEIIGDMR